MIIQSMVQRTFNVCLSLYASRKLTGMVEGKSQSAEQVAAMMLESHLFDYDDFVWINGDPREPWQPLDPDEPVRDLDEVMAELHEALDLQPAAEAQDKS